MFKFLKSGPPPSKKTAFNCGMISTVSVDVVIYFFLEILLDMSQTRKDATNPRLLNIINEPVFQRNFFNEQDFVFCKICNHAWKMKYSDFDLPPPPLSRTLKKGDYASHGCTTYKISNLTNHLKKERHCLNERLVNFFRVGEAENNASLGSSSARLERMEKREKRKSNQSNEEEMQDRQIRAQFRVAEFISELNMSAKQFPLTLKMIEEVEHILHPDDPPVSFDHYSNDFFCELLSIIAAIKVSKIPACI